jgi:dTDP-4-amino-4,6-dideoxygalactose transaminase
VIPFEDLGRVNRPYEEALRRAFAETLRSGRYILGAQGEAFEAELAVSLGGGHAVGVASGLDALALALRALCPAGGEAIVPASTCAPTALAVLRAGLTPVFSDPDPATWLLDAEDVERRVTPRTAAIVPVHLYGLVCDMDALLAVARRHGLVVLEDCAQAQGASWGGRAAGTIGDAGAFSFYPTKNLGALGDGGAVVTGSAAVADQVRRLRNYGYRERGRAVEVGVNARLDELQAAFLRAKLPRLRELVDRKNALAARYEAALGPLLALPRAVGGALPARSLFPVRHENRDGLRAALADRGIGTEVHYPLPLHLQEAFRPWSAGRLPVAERISREVVSLPLSVASTDEEIDAVIDAVVDFARRARPAPAVGRAAAGRAPRTAVSRRA